MATDYRFVEPQDVETVQFDWGKSKWMSSPAVTGSESFSAGVVVLEPGAAHERHVHPDSEEILYFMTGSGVQTVGDEEREVSAGHMVYISAGVEHSTHNTSWEPLRFIAVYGPPGPEAGLADRPDSTVLPPGVAGDTDSS